MNKKLLMPIGGMLGALLLILMLVFPILSMEVKNIPVGVVSLDAGMTTPKGEVNAGETMETKLLETENAVLNFQKGETESDLRQGLDEGKYYAIMIIPEDFTKSSMANEGKVKAVVNEGLHPMVTMQLTPVLTAMGTQAGITFETESINSITSLGMKAMLIPMMLLMMTFVVSLVTAFLITQSVEDKNKWVKYAKQLAYMVVMAVVIGFIVAGVEIGIAGVEIDIAKTAWYLALVSGAIMLLVNGAVNLFGRKGIIIPALLFILGVGTMQLPFEYLNGFWQTMVASWEPFRYIGNGMREVLYQGHGVWNSASVSIVVLSLVGIVFSVIKICKEDKNKKGRKK